MRLPRIKELYNPIMALLGFLGKADLGTIRNKMQDYFFWGENLDDDMQTAFEGRVNNACTNLYKCALLNRVKRGSYELTEDGENVLNGRKFISNINIKGEEPNSLISRINAFRNVEKIGCLNATKIIKNDTRIYNAINMELLTISGTAIKFSSGLTDAKITELEDEYGNLTYAITREVIFHDGSSIQKTWENIMPWTVPNSGKVKYAKTRKLLEIIKTKKTFEESLVTLMSEYKITESFLSELSGVSEKKIQRMRRNSDTKIEMRELAAIFIALRVPPQIVNYMVELSGLSFNSPRTEAYMTIIYMATEGTYGEINEYCRDAKIKEIFPQILEKNII